MCVINILGQTSEKLPPGHYSTGVTFRRHTGRTFNAELDHEKAQHKLNNKHITHLSCTHNINTPCINLT